MPGIKLNNIFSKHDSYLTNIENYYLSTTLLSHKYCVKEKNIEKFEQLIPIMVCYLLIFTIALKKIIDAITYPFSLVYGFIMFLRNKFYDWNLFRSTGFDFPIICVGNLVLGGTGKTPHVEYLINFLQKEFHLATLSRGYKRSTTGFQLANEKSTVNQVGDEPLQYKLKFKHITVAVDEKRVNGIYQIKAIHPETNVVLLDDAFQHRSVKPGLNILITDINKLYVNDKVLPAGRLREWSSGSKRADIIIVSKNKSNLQANEKNKIKAILNPATNQKIYFSKIKYGARIAYTKAAKNMIDAEITAVLLISGIANSAPLFEKLKSTYKSVKQIKFPDHHNYKTSDISEIKERFNKLPDSNKIIITTEKDIMRLSLPKILLTLQELPLFFIPIEICFDPDDQNEFKTQILKYVNESLNLMRKL